MKKMCCQVFFPIVEALYETDSRSGVLVFMHINVLKGIAHSLSFISVVSFFGSDAHCPFYFHSSSVKMSFFLLTFLYWC